MADQGPLSHTVLGGRYSLGVRLGSGGFADVYLAEHLHLKTPCAIKVLTRRLTSDEIEQFRREAQTIAALEHPHILRVRDFDLEGGMPFLVMDYAQNGSLRSRHPKGTRLPLITVVTYLKQIAEALQYAHTQGVVHRDIKPENMLVGKRDELLLSDFGIAVTIQTGKTHRTVHDGIGTPPYMAPEQFLGQVSPLSDQYSLGIVAYEWLCGERPFTSGDPGYQHNYVPPPPLRSKVPALQSLAEQAVLHTLEKEPEKRFNNVRAFAKALEHASKESWQSPRSSILLTYGHHLENWRGKAAWSPGGRYIVSADQQGRLQLDVNHMQLYSTVRLMLQIWEVDTKRHISTLGPVAEIGSLEWSPDETNIALDGLDGTQIWNLADGRVEFVVDSMRNRMHVHARHTALAWSPNGHYLALAGVFSTSSWAMIVYPMDNPEGKRRQAERRRKSCWAHVEIWDIATKSMRLSYQGHSDVKDERSVWALRLAWSPDSRYIASGGGNGTVQVWEADTGRQVYSQDRAVEVFTPYQVLYDVAWSPDGQWIALSSQDVVEVLEASTGQTVAVYRASSQGAYQPVWSPDSKLIASLSEGGSLDIWAAAGGGDVVSYQLAKQASHYLHWSRHGLRIASMRNDKVEVWQVQ